MKIKIYYDNIEYRLRGAKRTAEIIDKVIRKERRLSGDLSFIIMKDKSLRAINKEFLEHDYFTDVIAFGYDDGKIVNGEIYISIERVRINSYNYKVSLKNELMRVMVHGTLHLCGYDDKSKTEREVMRKKEDYWIQEMNNK